MTPLTKQKQKLLIFAGAGASVDSGLPAFRKATDEVASSATVWGDENVDDICSFSIWRKAHASQDHHKILHIHNFYKKLQDNIRKAKPNTFHHFVQTLIKEDIYDVTVVTTNVDDLFEKAGVPKEKVIHLHGSILDRRCPACNHTFRDVTDEWMSELDLQRCPRHRCKSRLVKTDVAFYGERCPNYLQGKQAFNRLQAGDGIIMVGSSGETFGEAKQLWAKCRKRNVHTVHINPQTIPHLVYPADLVMRSGVREAIQDLDTYLRTVRMVTEVIS